MRFSPGLAISTDGDGASVGAAVAAGPTGGNKSVGAVAASFASAVVAGAMTLPEESGDVTTASVVAVAGVVRTALGVAEPGAAVDAVESLTGAAGVPPFSALRPTSSPHL